MTVIAMTREMGTCGRDIAFELAESLGLRMVHHELVEHDLAHRLGVEESAVHHYLEGNASLLERWKIDKRKLSRLTAVEILELAQEGNVLIRGWGATSLLGCVPHVLRVRVCAPMEFRERVMMQRLGVTDRATVRREIERNDAAHGRTIQAFFGSDWADPLQFHVVINAQCLPVATAVRTLRLLADDPAFAETAATRIALADKLVEWRLRNALADSSLGPGLGQIDVRVTRGHALLMGSVEQPQHAKLARQIASEIAGLADVETQFTCKRSHDGA